MRAKIGRAQRQCIGDPFGLQLSDLASGQVKVAAIWAGESLAIPKLGPCSDGFRLCQVVGVGTKRGELWPVSGCSQLIGEVIPKGESVVTGVSITSGGEAVTVRAKEGVDLVMGSTKALSMLR